MSVPPGKIALHSAMAQRPAKSGRPEYPRKTTVTNVTYGRCVLGFVGCLLIAIAARAAWQEPEPPKADESKQKSTLYDAKADARTQVEVAAAAAKRKSARVLVMFGFEACGWCHKLHALFEQNAEVRGVLQAEYVLVLVDTQAPHASELLKECAAALPRGENPKAFGFPFLAVLDGDGKVLTAQPTEPLEGGKAHNPARVKEFLDRWASPRKGERAPAEAKKLQGHWTMVALEIDGKAVEESRLRGTTLEIRRDKYIVWTGKKPREMRFTLDASKDPAEIDLFLPEPSGSDEVHYGIYRLNGDTLRLCKAQAAGKPRPSGFKTAPASGIFLVTWKRQD